eukprot:c22065_g1_i1 orf=98-1078(+)
MALLHTSTVFSTSPRCSSADASFSFKALCSRNKVAGFSVCRRKLFVVAVSSLQCVRRPSLPRAGLLSRPTSLISERVICTDMQPGRKLELKYAKQPSKDFCEFMETTPKEEVVAFFRDVAGELEGFRQLVDFHMKIRDGEGDFRIEVFFGEERNGPEVSPYDDCIMCCPDANLFVGQVPGMAAGECILEEFSYRPYAICRLDAKGRSGFSVTPVRHVERMSDLDDNELYAMWSVAVRTVRHIGIPFVSLIMNHGTYRTLYHLNLKVWVDNELHEQYRSTWREDRKELWNRLQRCAVNRPKKQQLCYFYRRDRSCRHGDLCSFSHTE